MNEPRLHLPGADPAPFVALSRVVLSAVLLALAPPMADAQSPPDRIFDAGGFTIREPFSELPFERIDPLTGNVLLTFTDLVLPGNAGFALRIQRTYNSKIRKDVIV